MQPAPEKSEVVYRRVPNPGPAETPPGSSRRRRRGLAPALTPLIIGFVLLLALISAVGFLSVRLMDDVGFQARDVGLQRSARLSLLWELRLKVTRLDTEARARARTEARTPDFTPPFELRLNSARGEVTEVARRLDNAPLSTEPLWQQLRSDLLSYIEVTQDPRNYSLYGFDKFRTVDKDLNDLFAKVQTEDDDVIKRVLALQQASRRSIVTWSVIALAVGALVAAGTIWEVQRHFNQMRLSMLETRRERTFNTQLLQGMVSAVAAFDEEDHIRSANPAFFRIFPNASVGSSVLEKLGSDDAMKMLETVTSIRVTKATYHGRAIARVEDEDKAFDVYSSPLAIDGDRGQIVTLVDATEAAESERTLRRSESLAAVGQATTQVAHEIRNPLGSIRLGVSMLRDSVNNDPEALNTIELVERGIKHLNKLVVDVTQFSRQKELERSSVDLHESLERSIDLVADKIREKNANVEKHYSGASIVGQWDPYQLRQVFVNVIANAVDASQENSAVEISTELLRQADGDGQPARHYARITIADQGKGMDKATRERIFEPFFSTKKRGTGLGLAIVKQIVEQHGGRISVASEAGKGSKFQIDLPVL